MNTINRTYLSVLTCDRLAKIVNAVKEVEILQLVLPETRFDLLQHDDSLVQASIRGLLKLRQVYLFEQRPRGYHDGDSLVSALCEGCFNLETVYLKVAKISDRALGRFGALRGLKRLGLECYNNREISVRGVECLCNGKGRVEVLKMIGFSGISRDIAEAIALGFATRTSLKTLELSVVKDNAIDGICRILESCIQLSSLNISTESDHHMMELIISTFKRFMTVWPYRRLNLRKLSCANRDIGESFRYFECLPFLEHLQYRTFAFSSRLTVDKIACLQQYLPNLRHLDVEGQGIFRVPMLKALSKCLKLEILETEADLCEQEAQILVELFGSRLVMLQVGSVPVQCVEMFVNGFTKLTGLWISKATYVGFNYKERLIEMSSATVAPIKTLLKKEWWDL